MRVHLAEMIFDALVDPARHAQGLAPRAAVDQRDEMHETYQNEIERNFVRVMFGGEFFDS